MNSPESSSPLADQLVSGTSSTGTEENPVHAVQIQNLNYSFGQGENIQQVLFDVNLEIKPGELVILTGPSGCGKTTLLTLIGALRSVQQGSLRVLGRELNGLDKANMIAVRRNIGFIFQAHNLFDALSAVENVGLALNLVDYTPDQLYQHASQLLRIIEDKPEHTMPLNGVSRQKRAVATCLVKGLLKHLQVDEERLNNKPGQLSGGQRQRVAVARALVNQPRLLLADEPTAALDKVSSGIVIDLLKQLTQHGSTILVVTHDNRIMDKGDRIVAMKDGCIESNVLVDETIRICVFLQRVPLFSELTPGNIVEVAEKVRQETFTAGTRIIEEGKDPHPSDKFYMIKKGEVKVTSADGKVDVTLGVGQFFGDVSLVEEKPRNATVTAKTRVEMYTLEKKDFLSARESFESMREELMKVFIQRSRHH